MKTQGLRSAVTVLLLISCLLSGLSPSVSAQPTAPPDPQTKGLAEIESKVEARRRELGIPGMSLAIIKDDQVIFLKGLGFKDFEKKIAVTADTQFAIGSATKAFTALSVLIAQDQGKLSLEDSPKKALPYFKMYDPDADKNITIRDLLSHSSGLNRTDLAMITGKLNRAELVQVAAQARPTAKLREMFQYQNIMYTAAGEIVTQVQKKDWEKWVPDNIFKPLGMANSNMSIAEMEKTRDRSLGYDYNFDTKETRLRPYRSIAEVAPAGSINSSARDMAEWVKFVLAGGTKDGKRLVSEKGFDEWLKPQMKMNAAGTMNYGLGWFLQSWNGLKVVQHGGNIDGFNSLVAMIPEKKVGFVMLTNVSDSSLGNDIMPVIFSNLIDTPQYTEAGKLPLRTLQFMAGKYRLESPGVDIDIKIEGDDLVMHVPGQSKAVLVRFAPRQFKPAGGPDGFSVKFTPEQGDATVIELTQPNGVFKLKRVAGDGAAAATATAALRELVGVYDAPSGGTIAIKEADGKVTFNIAGQPPYELVEKVKDSYAMSPLPDAYSLKTKRDTSGKAISVVVTQPEGEFEFKRQTTGAKATITIDELRDKAVAATGGEAAWRKITSRVIEAEVDLENQGVKGSSISWSKAPNKNASEMTMTALGKPIASARDYFDGTTGEQWYSFLPAERYSGLQLDDIRLASDFYTQLDWKTNYKKVEIRGTGKVGGEEAYIVLFEPIKGTPFRELYSTTTFLLLRRDGVIPSSTSSIQIPYSITLSDYREVDGLKIAFKSVNNSIANGNVVTVVKSIKHNVAVDDKIFASKKIK